MSQGFDYTLDYKHLNLRRRPSLYRVGKGEQGVLMVEPYKSEILPHWRFRDPEVAKKSAREISKLFRAYREKKDFVGMDMARKFLQMGFTRARRYANHPSGRKYGPGRKQLPRGNEKIKAESAQIFFRAWKRVEADPAYRKLKSSWKERLG